MPWSYCEQKPANAVVRDAISADCVRLFVREALSMRYAWLGQRPFRTEESYHLRVFVLREHIKVYHFIDVVLPQHFTLPNRVYYRPVPVSSLVKGGGLR